jgi:5'-methylthioadenosine phosphorylase
MSSADETRWTLGIIGGSGLYEIPDVEDVRTVEVPTPFGPPSDTLTVGRVGDVSIVFVPRHGRGHRLSPTEVPYRANIWALRKLGAQAVLSVSAVGSLREDIEPGHVVVPDQVIDRTRAQRPATFFEDGVVVHVPLADPYCADFRHALVECARAEGADVHNGGTLICIEGPQFSTRAESLLYRSWGMDIIGMTVMPEARLAREAELCYATLAMATDYDCWHEAEEDVTVEGVLAVMRKNTERSRRIVRRLIATFSKTSETSPETRTCGCGDALKDAIMTAPDHVPGDARERLSLFLERYGY